MIDENRVGIKIHNISNNNYGKIIDKISSSMKIDCFNILAPVSVLYPFVIHSVVAIDFDNPDNLTVEFCYCNERHNLYRGFITMQHIIEDEIIKHKEV